MAPEDVYNMDETGLFYRAQPNKTLAQGKVCGRKIQKDHLTLALVVNMTYTDKLKPVIIYKSLRPRCFGRWLPTNYVWWFANQMAWMTSNVFESWMMSLNVHFKSQKWKVLLIMDNYATHSLKHVGRGESFGFSTLQLSNITIVFLPPNVTSVVQPLDQGIIASFKVQCKKKLLEWVLSQFDSSTTHHRLEENSA